MKLLEEFQVHEELNPKLFEQDKLREDVRDKIIEIVLSFEKYIKVPINIVDIQLVGSQASYNYTEKSDIDIHVIANYETVTDDIVLLQSLYDAKKSKFNDDFDITVKGIEVELYVENIKSSVVSNGIYSVCEDSWVKVPVKIETVEQFDLTDEISTWAAKSNEALSTGDESDIAELLNTLYLMRKNSIAVEGEWGRGNQLFKELRDRGIIKGLKDEYKRRVSKILSLESLTYGKLINEID